MKRAAIILAGGQAKRFQVDGEPWVDKALVNLFGKPLLIHVMEKVMPVVDEIIICVNNRQRKLRYSKLLRHSLMNNVKLCIDERFTFVKEGPAVAIATGLKTSNADYSIVLPCDVPFIQEMIVEHLFNIVKEADIAVPIHPSGKLEPLMMACRRSTVACIAETLCELGRDRPDDIIRGAPEVVFVSTVGELRDLDPEFKSFININTREDLKQLPTRGIENGPVKESIRLKLGCPTKPRLSELKAASKYYFQGSFLKAFIAFSFLSTRLEGMGLNFWGGISRENEGKNLIELSRERGGYRYLGRSAFMKAAQDYGLEEEIYSMNEISSLAQRAGGDKLRCQQLIDLLKTI